ncbi:MAG: hemAT 1 [Paenibacillus sp.]|uniref:globin-coupled sensor protein n=1 Tax=unclassified Paenibacillus TaxID=185978 RepID=UPI0029F10F7D|nr:hemAT 1 [Paenibacillus sp.]
MKKCPYHALTSLLKPSVKKEYSQHSSRITLPSTSPANDTVKLEAFADSQITAQLRMIALTEEDLRLLQSIQPFIMEHIDEIVDDFYKTVIAVNGLKDIIERHSTVERLRETLRQHLIEMFDGRLDAEFVQKRLKIAEVHQRIGLTPKWYMGAFQNLQNTLLTVLLPYLRNGEDSLTVGKSITKLLNFEQQLVLEAYEKKNVELRELQYERIKKELKHSISTISEELASITEQTYASTHKLIAASSQVNESVTHSTDRANESRSLAEDGAKKVSELQARIELIRQSSLQVERAVMQLKESSRQIGSIVTIVKDIASQTNLLSLNAAIEAARAGEFGAGFSVVAQEVKKLSDHTQQEVRQISKLIEQSNEYTKQVIDSIQDVQQQVEAGRHESYTTKETFAQIEQSLENGLSEISKSKQEMKQLAHAIEQMEEATHRAAVSAERLDATTRNY